MTHNRILVALNLTDGPNPAFERALALAKTSGAELYLLHLSQRASFTIAGPGWCLSIGVSCSARLVCG
jgi:nucleotide-binding universal stress UspA family protein